MLASVTSQLPKAARGLRLFSSHHAAAQVQLFNQRWAGETTPSEFNAALSAASVERLAIASDEAVAPYIKLLDQRWKGDMSGDDFTVALGTAAQNFNAGVARRQPRSKGAAMPATETVRHVMPFVELFNRKWSGALVGDLDAMLQGVRTRRPQDTATTLSGFN